MQTVRLDVNRAAETADIDGQGLTRQGAVADDGVQYLQASKYSLAVGTLHGHQADVAANTGSSLSHEKSQPFASVFKNSFFNV